MDAFKYLSNNTEIFATLVLDSVNCPFHSNCGFLDSQYDE